MVDKGDGRSQRPVGGRIRTLTQAALNADVTVSQVEAILGDLGDTLADLNKTTAVLDVTIDRFNDTITRIDELAPRLIAVVERLELIVDRVESMVTLAETVISPIVATENAVRGIVRTLLRHD
jgi:ABC-type transporter Mla subunit MlaD